MTSIGKPVRVSICIILALGALLGACAFGVKVGSRYRTYRLLFELGKRDALVAATRGVLGLQKSYGEMQQDLWIVLSAMPGKRDGYYVDVGSSDGVISSNTKLLDDIGWKGVCIDPFPMNMASRTCQVFRQPVFSVSGKKVSFRAATGMGGITDTLGAGALSPNVLRAPLVELVTATLDEILEKAKAPSHIDFMSIDVEGAEFEALRGLSFDKYQVEAFAIEHNYEQPKREAIRQLLESKGYTRVRSWAEDDWYGTFSTVGTSLSSIGGEPSAIDRRIAASRPGECRAQLDAIYASSPIGRGAACQTSVFPILQGLSVIPPWKPRHIYEFHPSSPAKLNN